MNHKVALDAHVLDWLLAPANLAMLLELRQLGRLEPIVTAEVAHEVHRMPASKAGKRKALQKLIADHFAPVKPTFVPILGLARLGLMYLATPRTEDFLQAVRRRGLRKLDALHVTNAHFHKCVAFLTQDERLLNKQQAIRDLTQLTLDRPEIWIRATLDREH